VGLFVSLRFQYIWRPLALRRLRSLVAKTLIDAKTQIWRPIYTLIDTCEIGNMAVVDTASAINLADLRCRHQASAPAGDGESDA
jgi:hypothetical protein